MSTPERSSSMPIDTVRVEDRHRADLGDLDGLAESIRDIGLLHPIVVTADGRLIAGERRLAACRLIGMTEVPVHVVAALADAGALLRAERDENTCRLDMTPTEKVALGRALELLERPRAQARSGRRTDLGKTFPQVVGEPGKTLEVVGAAVGMSRPTYQRARAIVTAAEAGDPAGTIALDRMERTGKVTGAYQQMRDAQKKDCPATAKRNPKPAPIDTKRGRDQAASHKRRVVEVISTLSGFARGVHAIDIEHASHAMQPGELAALADDLTRSLSTLRDFRSRLKEHA